MVIARTLFPLLVSLVLIPQGAARADDTAQVSPRIVHPQELQFFGPPQVPALSAAWAVGSEKGSGLYALRVRLSSKGVLPVHTHPDDRLTTVLSGKLGIGFGAAVDRSRMSIASAGDSYLVPAGTPHFLVALDGDVEYQEVGMGPTGTEMRKP